MVGTVLLLVQVPRQNQEMVLFQQSDEFRCLWWLDPEPFTKILQCDSKELSLSDRRGVRFLMKVVANVDVSANAPRVDGRIPNS
jgi:hypothetical protein